ncbi:hypothetical protein Efla_005917 [Eimeria flavescens]
MESAGSRKDKQADDRAPFEALRGLSSGPDDGFRSSCPPARHGEPPCLCEGDHAASASAAEESDKPRALPAAAQGPLPPPVVRRPPQCLRTAALLKSCLRSSRCDSIGSSRPDARNQKTLSCRLLQLPDNLLLLLFRFLKVEELPRTAAAASRLWRMLLRGNLLQPRGSLRLHSGRRWLKGCSAAEASSSSSFCSVVPALLTTLSGRLRRLALSRRVLECGPAPPLLRALRSQCSSLEELLIASADCSSEGMGSARPDTPQPSALRQGAAAAKGLLLSGPTAQLGALQQEAAAAAAASAAEAGQVQEACASLSSEDVEAAGRILAGAVFTQLQRLRVQGCQTFLWLRLLSKCSFPNCRELTVACACIRQHTVPPPHGAEPVGADLMLLLRSMQRLKRLHVEVALPPTRFFWRCLLFPEQEQQPPHDIQQLRVSEAVFLNVADVLAEAKRSTGYEAPGAPQQGPPHRCRIRDIRVLAAQRRLHPEIMFWRLSEFFLIDALVASCSVSSDFVAVHVAHTNSRPLMHALQHAIHLRLVIGSEEASAEEHHLLAALMRQHGLRPTEASAAAPAAAVAALQGPGLPASAPSLLPPVEGEQQEWQQRQLESLLAGIAAEARETAAAASRLFQVSFAAREYSLDIRDDRKVLFRLQQASQTLGKQLCRTRLFQLLEAEQQQGAQQQRRSGGTPPEARVAAPPSVRVVGWPACVSCCLLPGKTLAEEAAGSAGHLASCKFCSCCSKQTQAAAGEDRRGNEAKRLGAGSGGGEGVCVCFALQMRVLPLLYLLPSFVLGHSGGGSCPWFAAALLQSDVLLLHQVCSSAALRQRCAGLEVEATGLTPLQRKSFLGFLNAVVCLPETLRPPLRLLRLSLLADSGGPACASEEVRLSGRVLQTLLTVLQQYPLVQQVEVTAPLFLRDPAEEPSAELKPLPLLQLQLLLQQQGFTRCSCDSRSALRHTYVFTKAALPSFPVAH